MSTQKLLIAGKAVRLHGALAAPDFRTQRVLCSDPFEFVGLWLKRKHKKEAQFYWDQAAQFYQASKLLPVISAPLPAYYCFLNASKALLSSAGEKFTEAHGVGGSTEPGRASLANERVDFLGSGVLPSLCTHLGEPPNAGRSFTLQDLLWQMPFVHRAYCLSYKSATELFIPLHGNCFMKRDGSREAWFQAEIDRRYINAHTEKVIRPGFELFETDGKRFVRRRRRFRWSGRDIESSLVQFKKYHKTIRRRILPIFASENRWYLKKSVSGSDEIDNSQLTLMYAAMHRLSELSRYDPIALSAHLNVNHNWLLSEFIRLAPSQFIYGIASEITGLEFIRPDAF